MRVDSIILLRVMVDSTSKEDDMGRTFILVIPKLSVIGHHLEDGHITIKLLEI